MARAVALPIVFKTFNRILQRVIFLEEAIHTDNFEDIAQEWTHTG